MMIIKMKGIFTKVSTIITKEDNENFISTRLVMANKI